MLEIPESHTLARQINETVKGRTIQSVAANSSPHGFAFYHGDPQGYDGMLSHHSLDGARAVGGMVQIDIGDFALVLGDGVNLRYLAPGQAPPAKHQLYMPLDDGSALVVTVQMYGGILAIIRDQYNNSYYRVALEKPNPLTDAFDAAHFEGILAAAKPSLSVKALLATEQRIPGLGNGVLQDILFTARLHPKRKVNTLRDGERETLFHRVRDTLRAMTEQGGRDTEKNLLGQPGGYRTLLSNKTLAYPCPVCGGGIVRQAYLGGNIYFCPTCQPV